MSLHASLAMSHDLDLRLQFALDAAAAVQPMILDHYQNAELQVDLKEDHSPVTLADRGAEEQIRERLANAFPDDGVFGEEFGEQPGSSGYRWVLDPIDGTKAFVAGVPLFGTMIGLEQEGRCVLGVVRFPALDEVVYAREGGGCWHLRGNGQPTAARVRSTPSLQDALLCFTDVDGWRKAGAEAVFQSLCNRTRISRGWGDCYGHCLVALGRADVMVDPLLNPWDAAALVPIVTEAGGVFVDWRGEPTIHGGNGISTTPALRDAVLEIVSQPLSDC